MITFATIPYGLCAVGVIKWASRGGKRCFEKVAAIEDIEMDVCIDEMIPW